MRPTPLSKRVGGESGPASSSQPQGPAPSPQAPPIISYHLLPTPCIPAHKAPGSPGKPQVFLPQDLGMCCFLTTRPAASTLASSAQVSPPQTAALTACLEKLSVPCVTSPCPAQISSASEIGLLILGPSIVLCTPRSGDHMRAGAPSVCCWSPAPEPAQGSQYRFALVEDLRSENNNRTES